MSRPAVAVAFVATLIIATAQYGVFAQEEPLPLAPCLLPEQPDDIVYNAQHLWADLNASGGVAGIISTEPSQSPHVARVTVPGTLLITSPIILANIDVLVCGDVIVTPAGSLTTYGATLTLQHPTRNNGGLFKVSGLADEAASFGGRAVETGFIDLNPLQSIHDDDRIGGLVSQLLFTHPDRPTIIEGADRPVRVVAGEASRLSMYRTVVRNATGVEVTEARALEVSSSVISAIDQALYIRLTDAVHVDNSTLLAGREGMLVTTVRDLTVLDTVIIGHSGMIVQKSNHVRLHGSHITAQRDGFYVFDTEGIIITNTTIDAVSGIYTASAQDILVAGTTIRATGSAITHSDTRDIVHADNVMEGQSASGGIRGIYLERTKHSTIDRISATNFDTGLHILTGEQTDVHCGTFTGNGRGVYVSSTTTVDIEGGIMHSNTLNDLHGFLAPDINAADNWWGQATGPLSGQIREAGGSVVDASPHATAAPSCPAVNPDREPPHVVLTRPLPHNLYLLDDRVALLDQVLPPVVAVGAITMEALAWDGQSGIERVTFMVDGFVKHTVDGDDLVGGRAAYTYDPPLGYAGPRSFAVRATDGAGFTTTTTLDVLFHAGTDDLL